MLLIGFLKNICKTEKSRNRRVLQKKEMLCEINFYHPLYCVFLSWLSDSAAYAEFAVLMPTSFKSGPKCGEISGKLKSKPTANL